MREIHGTNSPSLQLIPSKSSILPVFDSGLPVRVAGFGVGDADVEDEAAVGGNVLRGDQLAVGGNLEVVQQF